MDFIKIGVGGAKVYKEKNKVIQFVEFKKKNSMRHHYMDKLPVCQQMTFVSNQMRRPDSEAPVGLLSTLLVLCSSALEMPGARAQCTTVQGPHPVGADGPGGAGLWPETGFQSTIFVLPGAVHCHSRNPAGATAVPLPHLGTLPLRALGGPLS